MGLSTYNGFPGHYRERVQGELERMWASGLWDRPTVCSVCGQTEGAIHGHLEDYSRPETYVPLCITCHLMLHMRFREPALWADYTEWICMGYRAPGLEQGAAMAAIRSRFRVGRRAEWPGECVNPQRRATYLDGLAPVKFTHPHAPADADVIPLF